MVNTLGQKIDLNILNNYLIFDPNSFSFQLKNYTDNKILYSYNSTKIYHACTLNKLLIAIIFCLKYKSITEDEKKNIYNMIAKSSNKDTIIIDSKITHKDEEKFFYNYYPEFKNNLKRIKITDYETPVSIEFLVNKYIDYNNLPQIKKNKIDLGIDYNKEISFDNFLLSLHKNFDNVRYYNGDKLQYSGKEDNNFTQINCNIFNKIIGDLFTDKFKDINEGKDIIINAMKECKTGHSHKYLPKNKFDIYCKTGTFKNFRHEHDVFYFNDKLYGLIFLSKSSVNYPYGINNKRRGHVTAGLIYLLLKLDDIRFDFFEIKHNLKQKYSIKLFNSINKYNIQRQQIYGLFNISLDNKKIYGVNDPIIKVIGEKENYMLFYNFHASKNIILEPIFFEKKYSIHITNNNKKEKVIVKGYLNITINRDINKDYEIGSIMNKVYF